MGRWRPAARERLRRAALELFADQGFAATTVPEITARAGLTTRTFFRYFPDKRAVLFDDDELAALAEELIADVPPSVAPVAMILDGLRTISVERFDPRRDDIRLLRDLVRLDESVRERDLRKRAMISEIVCDGLVARGTDRSTAAVVGEVSVMVLYLAIDDWLDRDGGALLFDSITAKARDLRAIAESFDAESN